MTNNLTKLVCTMLAVAGLSACGEGNAAKVGAAAVNALLEEFNASKGEGGAEFARRLSEASAGIQDNNVSLSGCL